MTPTPPVFQHSYNSAWLTLATLESLQPPYLFDLSLQLADLIDESAPVLTVHASEQDQDAMGPFLNQLRDALGPDRMSSSSLHELDLEHHQGRIGGLILYGGSPLDWVQAASRLEWKESTTISPFIDLVLSIGAPCAAAGEWMLSVSPPNAVTKGLGWVPHGIVTPGLGHPADLPVVRELLLDEPRSFAIGLPPGGILALGPSGELEIWSEINPGILLGKGWGQA